MNRSAAGITAGKCGAVVLAAGEARRFGAPKLLMPFGDSTVVGSVVAALTLAGAAPIVVVAGAKAVELTELLAGSGARVVNNPNPGRGMVSSIQIGVEALPQSLACFLIALGDQPRIQPKGIAHLVHQYATNGAGIALPTYGGKRGHPILFGSAYRAEILGLDGNNTLRSIIEAHREDILEVDMDSDAYLCDIDTREEYEDELRRWRTEE